MCRLSTGSLSPGRARPWKEYHTDISMSPRQTRKKEDEERADADREKEEDVEKTQEEPQQAEWRGDTGNQKKDANQDYGVAE
ncbi:hypothetical protein NDU88_002347 [Pleurodeles waltl]|uniref:Uncharacterized protein n=1 Tax=Pleurodeles waltl TaxID=8319 RepID=A0AAV7NID8_PLEWA|nr:hypothetical protein NDU88_002347 [Pleurodeles waltl]